jgi:hypothetical protein
VIKPGVCAQMLSPNTQMPKFSFQSSTLSEFNCALASKVLDVFQLELLEPSDGVSAFLYRGRDGGWDLLLALSVEVDALDATRDLVEADVVEALKARSAYCPDAVVWHEEVFFPSHEQVLLLHPVLGHQFLARGVL